MYGKGMITSMDVKFRASLRGDMSKALYRFLQGQSGFIKRGRYDIGLLKLCVAINLDPTRPASDLRKLIRKGLRELRKKGYLKNFKVSEKDIVTMRRNIPPELLKNKKVPKIEKTKWVDVD